MEIENNPIDLPWGDERKRKFTTNVGLITTNGKYGNNVMAAEWTHHISYSPGIIAVSVGDNEKTTSANIEESGFFGVNLASEEQAWISNIVGNHHAKDVDKIEVLREMGVKFTKGIKTDLLMIEGSAMQAECKVIFKKKFGGHIMYVGEIIELYTLRKEKPLIYFEGKYFKSGEQIAKPSEEFLEKIKLAIDKNKR